jgi:hypothetical protein
MMLTGWANGMPGAVCIVVTSYEQHKPTIQQFRDITQGWVGWGGVSHPPFRLVKVAA